MTPDAPISDVPYDWMTRLARLRGCACLAVDANMTISYLDPGFLTMGEIDVVGVQAGDSLLVIIEYMAERGDFGPGDPAVFKQLMHLQLALPVTSDNPSPRHLRLQTPSGRRLRLTQSISASGESLIICEDETQSYFERNAMRIALDSSSSGYVVYDMHTRKFASQTNISRSELGKALTTKLIENGLVGILHPDDVDACRVALEKSQRDRQPFDVTVRIQDEQVATRWFKAMATPQISESGIITAYIIFYTDVTAQLRIHTELNQAREQAEKALTAKNNFLGRLSHEIRTPMNAVVGIADALIYHHADTEITPKLKLIQTSADKIVRIVDESLQHTKLEENMVELNPHKASPCRSVRAVCALWEEKAKTNAITLTCTIDPSVPDSLVFDDHRYEQCLNNLLSNAIKFAPGGRIDVVLTTLPHASGDRLVLAVKDTGIGMSEAQLENLFDPFTQADKTIATRFGGSGLGMSIVKQIIELMGGRVSAKSVIGQGTVIALTLPVEAEQRVPEASHTSTALVSDMIESATPQQSDYADLRVLVVDDNSTNHIVVKSLLDTLVHSIVTADNGKEAIACLETQTFDIVLMDIHMPIMDGIEATLSIRGANQPWSDVPIIALTADPQYQQRRLCRNIGMNDALGKPFKLTELLSILDDIISPQIAADAA